MFDKKPEEVIRFVLIFLPGFICLAIANSLVDLDFSEFEYIYVGISLSILIYLVSLGLAGVILCLRSSSAGGKGESCSSDKRSANLDTVWPLVALIVPSTVVVAWLFALCIQNDWLNQGMRAISPVDFVKRYRGSPEQVLLKSHYDCTTWSYNARPADRKNANGEAMKYQSAHQHWMRISVVNGTVFEGFPQTFDLSAERSEYFLSPACRLERVEEVDGVVTRAVDRVEGPGVLILDGSIHTIELLDTDDSQCYFLFYGNTKAAECEEEED